MANHLKFYKDRALVLATAGMLTGSPLAMATDGLIQAPEIVEIPVQIIPGGGGTTIRPKFIYAKRHTSVEELTIFVTDETFAELKKAEPLKAKNVEPVYGFFDDEIRLVLVDESEARHWNKDDDEDNVLLLLLAIALSDDDEELFS